VGTRDGRTLGDPVSVEFGHGPLADAFVALDEPPPMMMDNLLWDRLADLAACLCTQIEDPANGVPEVCFCGVVPGEQASAIMAAGNCAAGACGMAWVRMMSTYPMKAIGVVDATPGNCGASLGADIEMGILRCFSLGDESGRGPTMSQLMYSTRLQVADSVVMQKAILCCNLSPKEFVLNTYTPLGPAGDLVGGSWQMSIGLK